MTIVCAVTVTYADRFEYLCKATIERAIRSGVSRIVVVDNGSSAESAMALHAFNLQTPEMLLIRCGRNEGSAVAFGLALSAAFDTRPDFIWLLDDDNWVGPDALTHLLEAQAKAATHFSDPLTAVCASREPNGFHERVRAGASVDSVYPPVGAFLGFDLFSYLTRRLKKPACRIADFPVIPYAPYGGLLIRCEVLTKVGPPRSQLVLYSDDTDWTMRIGNCGHRIILATSVLICDADGKWLASVDKNSVASMMQTKKPARLYLATRNRVWIDHQRLRYLPDRVRYYLNRRVVMTVAWVSAHRGPFVPNYSLFRRATVHAEAGDFSHSPQLGEVG